MISITITAAMSCDAFEFLRSLLTWKIRNGFLFSIEIGYSELRFELLKNKFSIKMTINQCLNYIHQTDSNLTLA